MKIHKTNFKLLNNYSYFTPGIQDIVILCLFLIGGGLLGNGLVLALSLALKGLMDPKLLVELTAAIAYPLTFIPAMLYAANRSHRNEVFEPSFPLDSNNFGKFNGVVLALVAAVSTLCLSLASDSISYWMPPMPEWLEKALESITDGNIFISLLMAAVLAPFFEEWLCRGIILRGLLHCERENGKRGFNPIIAIIISAALFALIHLNPWQAIPAFLFGLLFGFVYYKTGSLKLTMLMHCVNNATAVILTHIDSLSEYDHLIDILGVKLYCIMAVASCIFLILAIRVFNRIPVSGTTDENAA